MILQSHSWAYIWRKTRSERKYPPPVFFAAQFKIAKKGKQSKCPLTDKSIKKMWHIHAMDYYSAI